MTRLTDQLRVAAGRLAWIGLGGAVVWQGLSWLSGAVGGLAGLNPAPGAWQLILAGFLGQVTTVVAVLTAAGFSAAIAGGVAGWARHRAAAKEAARQRHLTALEEVGLRADGVPGEPRLAAQALRAWRWATGLIGAATFGAGLALFQARFVTFHRPPSQLVTWFYAWDLPNRLSQIALHIGVMLVGIVVVVSLASVAFRRTAEPPALGDEIGDELVPGVGDEVHDFDVVE